MRLRRASMNPADVTAGVVRQMFSGLTMPTPPVFAWSTSDSSRRPDRLKLADGELCELTESKLVPRGSILVVSVCERCGGTALPGRTCALCPTVATADVHSIERNARP